MAVDHLFCYCTTVEHSHKCQYWKPKPSWKAKQKCFVLGHPKSYKGSAVCGFCGDKINEYSCFR